LSILAVGTVAFDSIETPHGSADRVLGGSATYITLAARFFGEPVRLVGVVGGDFPLPYIEALRGCGVDLEGLEVDAHGATFAWAGRYHADMNGRDTLATHLNVLQTFSPTLPARFRNSRIVCLGNLDPNIQHEVLDQVDAPELVICDTMNFWIEHAPEALDTLLGRIDCLMINDQEARQLAGETNLLKAARAILRRGPRILVVKKGEHGGLVVDEESVFAFPAFPLEHIQDPTGAGDTFMGGFAGYLAQENDRSSTSLRRAIMYGSALASFTVERFGPERLLHLAPEEIDARMHAYRRVAHFPEWRPLAVTNGSADR
jgi:sugar/nucleoside kinase (ribokinase family)